MEMPVNVKLPQAKRRSPRKAPVAPGERRAPADAGGTELPLPHERDQSTGQTAAAPDPVIQQAKADLDAGLTDTDLRGTPGADAARQAELLGKKP